MCAPDPTPPRETSAAQTGTSVSTAIANSVLNNPNEIGPDGTKSTRTDGYTTVNDPYTGQSYQIPNRTVTTTLSSEQQRIKTQSDAAKFNLASLGNNLSGTLGQKLQGNFSLGNEATESRLMDLGRKRLDPMLAQRKEGLETQLSNQGIKLGSAAYDRAMNNNTQGANDAYNELLLRGRGQASQELLTEDNQRINQVGALLSGGQVSQPNFMTGFQGTQIPTTDNAGIIANYDQAKAAQARANGAGFGSLLGGLGGLFQFSDKRLKKDISKVGKTNDGQNVYSYRYKAGGPMQLGLMANEVEKIKPEAVITGPQGYKMVNYAKAISLGVKQQ